MEIRHLKYFLAVAEELSFNRAANKLCISQPPLSRQIKELERELHAQLFERNNKRVALTNAGRYFEREVRQILQSLEAASLKTRKIAQDVSGEFRIGYISSTFSESISALVQFLRHEYPYVNFKLFEMPTVDQISLLEEGKLDLSILRAPILSSKVRVRHWFNDHFSLVFNNKHIRFDPAQGLKMLSEATFVFFNRSYAPHFYNLLLEICARHGFVPNVVHESNNINSIIQLVRNGMGISIVPSSISKNYCYDEITFHELVDIPIFTEVLLATPNDDADPEITKKAVSYVCDKLSLESPERIRNE